MSIVLDGELKSSKYNIFVDDNDSLLIFNSLTKKTIAICNANKKRIKSAIETGNYSYLTENEKELFRSYFQLTDKEAEDLFQSIETELECVQSETEVINWKRKNGIDFEKCIVKMLNPQYYTLQEWT